MKRHQQSVNRGASPPYSLLFVFIVSLVSVDLSCSFQRTKFAWISLRREHEKPCELYAAPKRLEDNVDGMLYVNDRVRYMNIEIQSMRAVVSQTFDSNSCCSAALLFETYSRKISASTVLHALISPRPYSNAMMEYINMLYTSNLISSIKKNLNRRELH